MNVRLLCGPPSKAEFPLLVVTVLFSPLEELVPATTATGETPPVPEVEEEEDGDDEFKVPLRLSAPVSVSSMSMSRLLCLE